MRIEAGRFYKTRDGDKVGPMQAVPKEWGYRKAFVWTDGERRHLWTDDGRDSDWEPQKSDRDLVEEWAEIGPVRTVTRKEIVPGIYGRLIVSAHKEAVHVSMVQNNGSACWKADELRAAAATLNEIADALGEAE